MVRVDPIVGADPGHLPRWGQLVEAPGCKGQAARWTSFRAFPLPAHFAFPAFGA
jgi:hypothetical protein